MEIFNKLTDIYKYIHKNNINIDNIINYNNDENKYVSNPDKFIKFIIDITNNFISLKNNNKVGGGRNFFNNNTNNIANQNINKKDVSNYTEYYKKYLINDNINTFKYNKFLEEHDMSYLNNYLIIELTTIIDNFDNIYKNNNDFIKKKNTILKDINNDNNYIKENLIKNKLTNKEKNKLKIKKK